MFESENFRFFFLSTKNSLTCTLGARGFSCAVSGFGQVLKSDPREKLFFFLAASPAADKTKLPVAREKKPLVPRVLNLLGSEM